MKYKPLFLAFLLFFIVSSCSKAESDSITDIHASVQYHVKHSAHITFETSLKNCVENADLVIEGKVTQIGEPKLYDGYKLEKDMSEIEIKDNIWGIYTRITFDITNTYKNSIGFSNDIIEFNKGYGTYNEIYRLYPFEIEKEFIEGTTYLLFLKEYNGVYSVLSQQSLEIKSDKEFSSMFGNDDLYKDYSSYKKIVEAVKSMS